ncbi:N-acetylneuraminate synthase family protein [Candidatus Pelagibacter ubique]|nr:N-acetylneuraminate synthase family protein [Candidatus Pelagibacter ubique]
MKNKKLFIIAEIGAKYGSIGQIIKLIKSVKKIGADAVKFQTYNAKYLSDKSSLLPLDGKKITQHSFFLKNQLTHNDHKAIIAACKKIKLIWFSTPAHFIDVDYLEKFQPKIYKIGSDDLTNIPLIKYIAQKKKKIILSTGMSDLIDIKKAVKAIEEEGNKKIEILHCVSDYPTEIKNVNLNVIKTLKKNFNYKIGLSDHTNNDLTSILATTMGAEIIEKHIIPSYKLKNWPDAEASLDVSDFGKMIFKLRNIKKAYGSKKKIVFNCEKKWKIKAHKSLYAIKNIKKGELIKPSNILIRRPKGKTRPVDYYKLINKKAKFDINKDDNLTLKIV